MKKLIVVLTILLISTLCFAWSASKDNPEKNIQSSDSDGMQQSIKRADVNGVNEEINKEAGNYIGSYILAGLTPCQLNCKLDLKACNRSCETQGCRDECMYYYDSCMEKCYEQGF